MLGPCDETNLNNRRFGKLRECTTDPVYLDLLQKPAQYVLLCWVALVRSSDSSLSFEDRQRCPFPWCDAMFAETDHMELVNHVSGCAKMSHGSYVCPYHQRTETFMIADAHSEHRTRRHFFKHAFEAIRKLGSKGIKKAIHPSRAGSRVDFKTGKKRMRSNPDFKESLTQSVLPELHGNDLTVADEADTPIVPPQPPKRVSRHSTSELPSTRSIYYEMEGLLPVSETPVAELASKRMSRLTTSENVTGSSSNSDFSISPVSPISSNHWFETQDFASPISPEFSNFSSLPWSSFSRHNQAPQAPAQPDFVAPRHLDASANVEPPSNDAGIWMTTGTENSPRSFPKIRIDTACAAPPTAQFGNSLPTQPSHTNSNLGVVPSPLQIDSDNRSPIKSVEELRGLFHQCFKLSCKKIIQPPISPAGAALFRVHPTSASIFEKGCKALSKVMRGILPCTFWEVFGLAHLAYASALADQEPELVELLPEMYEDLTRWSEAIKTNEDKAGYLDLIQQLFTPESNYLERLALGNRTLQASSRSRRVNYNAASGSLNDLNRLWSAGRTVSQPEQFLQRQGYPKTEQSLLSSLRQGIIVQLCLRYLGGKSADAIGEGTQY